jgi:outer membrane protein assembly factor BamB
VGVIMADSDPQPLRPFDPTTVGPYRLVGRLGAGGMGEVYLGRDGGGRLAAVKVIHDGHSADPGFRARFAREVGIAKKVRLAWSAAVVDADPDAPTPWLATEYVAGPSLAALVTATGPLSEPSAGAFASMLATALTELHELDVVHRDLQPSNVLIADDGPRLIDFGIARAADASSLTQTGMVLGAPGYMSPEQALGVDSGPPSDVFSLAAVAVYAATGSGPFGASASPVAMLRRIVDEQPDLRAVPDRLRQELEPCLAKDPAARPTAADLAARLVSYRGAGGQWPPVGSTRMSSDVAPRFGRRVLNRRKLIDAAAVGAVTLGAAMTGMSMWRPASEPQLPPGTIRWSFAPDTGREFRRIFLGNGLIIADQDAELFALDLHTGQLRWQLDVGTGHYTRMASYAQGVYFSHDGRGIFAVDSSTGGVRWEQDGAVAIAAGESILLGRMGEPWQRPDGDLLGLDHVTGGIRWRHPIPSNETVTCTAFGASLVHVGFRETLTTFDAATGRVQWSIPWPSGYAFGGLDTYEGALVGAQTDQVMSLDATTGALRWSHPIDNEGSQSAPVVHGETVCLSTLERLFAWDAATGQPRWSIGPRSSDRPMWFHPEPVGAGGLLHVALWSADDDHGLAEQYEICAVDVADGALRGAVTIEGGGSRGREIVSSPATHDSVCFGTRAGIHAIGP